MGDDTDLSGGKLNETQVDLDSEILELKKQARWFRSIVFYGVCVLSVLGYIVTGYYVFCVDALTTSEKLVTTGILAAIPTALTLQLIRFALRDTDLRDARDNPAQFTAWQSLFKELIGVFRDFVKTKFN